MSGVIFNAILPILGMIAASNFCSAFGIWVMPEFLICAIVTSVVLMLPMASATLSFLVVAVVADLNYSGPPGLVTLLAVLLYLVIRMLMQRVQPQRVLGMAVLAFLATFVFHAALAAAYSLYYPEASLWHIFLAKSWIAALMTAVAAPILVWVTNLCAVLFQKKKSELS